MQDEYVIYYEVLYSVDKGRIQKFVTLIHAEALLKTSEVLAVESSSIHLQLHKFISTKSHFMAELRKAAQCV